MENEGPIDHNDYLINQKQYEPIFYTTFRFKTFKMFHQVNIFSLNYEIKSVTQAECWVFECKPRQTLVVGIGSDSFIVNRWANG